MRSFVAALWFGSQRCLRREFANSAAGVRALVRWLASHCVDRSVRVGAEATNTFADAVLEHLYQQGYTVFLLNPERLACYARSCGQRNKTDPADAAMIAAYIARHDCTPWQPPAPEQKELRELTRTRHQLTEIATQLVHQIRTATGAGKAALEASLREVRNQIAALVRQIKEVLRRHPALQRAIQVLTSMKGLGLVTAATLLAELPPVTKQTDPRTIAAWAGLTPRRMQSGPHEWRTRLSRKGNHYVQQALYMPALVAKRWNPLFRHFAADLKQRGKSTPAILGAVSHKMLRIAVGLLRSDTEFDPNWSPQKN